MMDLVMDRRVVWNASRLREIDEAKATINFYRSQGYEVIKSDGSPLEKFLPSLEEVVIKAHKITKKVLKILTEKGDERLVWDKENGKEAIEAKSKFNEFLKKGYTAFSVDAKGKKNRKIEEFDVEAEEILMIPQTVKG